MKIVTLAIACEDSDGEFIANQLISSDVAQIGLFSWGTDIREATDEEVKEIFIQRQIEE